MPRSSPKRKPAATKASPDLSAILGGISANPGVLDEATREPTVLEQLNERLDQPLPGVTVGPYQPRTNREVSDDNDALLAARAGPLAGQPVHDPVTFEPRPDLPLPLTGGVTMRAPHQVDLEELLGTDPDGVPVRFNPDGSVTVLDPLDDPELGRGDPLVDPNADLTIGEVLGPIHGDPEQPTLRGFEMSDEPLPIPAINFEPETEQIVAHQPPPAGVSSANAGGGVPGRVPTIDPATENILTPSAQRVQGYSSGGVVRYEGRIRILEAFQYLGRLDSAPTWVDRSWLGYSDYDDLRKIEPGPCLRVPLMSGQNAICRIGDFCVQQEVVLQQGMLSDVRVEVWPKEEFVKNFMPVVD